MTDNTIPRRPRAQCARIRSSPGPAREPERADLFESAIWPLLPRAATRALSMTLLLVLVVGAMCGIGRQAYGQPNEILLSNGSPPPSPRLLLVNFTQRQVAQEFTTGPHPAGYDVHAVAVRTEMSHGKREMGLQGIIRSRRWEPVGPWNIMLPHRQVGPVMTLTRPVADADWSWFTSPEPIHLAPNETYFFELICRWGCYVPQNRVGLGLTESNDEDDGTLPGWSMADGFLIQNSRFNRWWGDLVVGVDGFFHPDPQGPALRLALSGEPTAMDGLPPGDSGTPELSASDARVREGPHSRLAFQVTLSRASAAAVSVRYSTADGTATAGLDYVATSGRLTFAPGQTERTVSVQVLHDAHGEGAETLTLRLSGATGARLADREATGTIVNAGPKAREWMAQAGPSAGLHVAHPVGARLDGELAHVTAVRLPPQARDAERPGGTPAARIANPARGLVGMWSTRFGAMPIPPHPPSADSEPGVTRRAL